MSVENIHLTPIDRAMKERETHTQTLIQQCQDRIKVIKRQMIDLSNEEDRLEIQLNLLKYQK
jgi:hypothetical protein